MGLQDEHLENYDFYLKRNDIPLGWEIVTLDEISYLITDGTHKTPKYIAKGVRFISIKNIKPYKPINWNSYEKYISKKEHEDLIKRCHPEIQDILFPRIGTLGYAKRIDFDEEVSLFVGLGLLKPVKQYVSPKFIEYYLNTPYIERLSQKKANGTGRKTLPLEQSRVFPFPLPPLNEQRRIVAKIEQLFSELDKGIESLKTAREQLKVYRQAVLEHAFKGKLTAKWREENEDKLESPEQLFTRIKQERESRYQQRVEEWETALKKWEKGNKKGRKPAKPNALKSVSNLTDESYQLLPDTWIWEKLGWLTCGVEYGTATKSSESGAVPVIRMGNLQNGNIDWDDLVYTSDDDEIKKYSLNAGDILFNRTNSPELVGKTAIYRGERSAVFAGYLIRLNHIKSIVDGQYLNMFLNSHTAKRHGNSVKTDGVNQSNINGEKLQSYPFPYCSLDEQKEIVRIIDEKLSITDRSIKDIEEELIMSSLLRQAILKKAFSGQLVSQNPNDEPASVLLERICAEKDTHNEKQKASNNVARMQRSGIRGRKTRKPVKAKAGKKSKRNYQL